jgi:hypothetical protein
VYEINLLPVALCLFNFWVNEAIFIKCYIHVYHGTWASLRSVINKSVSLCISVCVCMCLLPSLLGNCSINTFLPQRIKATKKKFWTHHSPPALAVSKESLWVCLYIRFDKHVPGATNNWWKRLPCGLCRMKGKQAISYSRQRGRSIETRLSENTLRTESNVWSQVPEWARYLDILTDWPSVVTWQNFFLFIYFYMLLFLPRAIQMKVECGPLSAKWLPTPDVLYVILSYLYRKCHKCILICKQLKILVSGNSS